MKDEGRKQKDEGRICFLLSSFCFLISPALDTPVLPLALDRAAA
jgi:hypothetical protein